MPLTREFKKTVKERAERDPALRNALLQEAIETLMQGEVEVAKLLLRNYINATVGFQAAAEAVDKSTKSVMNMLGPRGNPSSKSLLGLTSFLLQDAGAHVSIVVDPPKRKAASSRKSPRKRRTGGNVSKSKKTPAAVS